MREAVSTERAPRPVGPYSQAIVTDDMMFCSGQIGIDPTSGRLVEGVTEQTERCLDNLQAVLETGGSSLGSVVRTTIYLVDMNDFTRVNTVYAKRFGSAPPARTTVGVAALPLGARVEIDAISVRPGSGR